MANTYRRLGINLLATAGSDIRVKVSANDTTSGFLSDKIVAPSSGKLTTSILNANASEQIVYDLNEASVDHDALLNYETTQHRVHDDAQTTTTTLWSSQKVQDELDDKVNKIDPVADNRLLKSVGTTGVDMEQTSITVDDSGNVTGIQDLTVSGNLTVDGTTTSVNSSSLEVTDANITINDGGTQASADLASSGITVEMSDATDAVLGYDSALTSRFKLGESGDLREVVTVSHTQSLNNKSIDADVNTISNLELDNMKSGAIDLDDTLSTADDSKVPTSLTVKTYVDTALDTQDEASEVIFTPAGDIIATNVQDAIEELDSEKITSSGARTENLLVKYNASGQVIDSGFYETAGKASLNSTTNTFNFKVHSSGADSALHMTNIITGETVSDGLVIRTTNLDAKIENKEAGDVEISSNGSVAFTAKADGTLEANAALYDTLVINDNVLTNKKYVDDTLSSTSVLRSAGDIDETSYVAPAGVSDADVVGFAFNNATVRSFSALVSVERFATANFYEVFELKAVNIAGNWNMSYTSTGEDSDISFDIEATGQVTYTDEATPSGHTSTIIKFRAITTSV